MLKQLLLRIWRYPLKLHMRSRLKNKNFVIVSSNCIGGTLLHDLGQPFNSPTVNLTIPDFVSFCENLQENMAAQPVYVGNHEGRPYPCFSVNGILIHGVHYKDPDSFLEAWNRRVQRFFEKHATGAEILLMAADSQLKTEDALKRFSDLPYRKVCFMVQDISGDCFLKVPSIAGDVGDLTRYVDILGRRVFEKYLDCVAFINGEEN